MIMKVFVLGVELHFVLFTQKIGKVVPVHLIILLKILFIFYC